MLELELTIIEYKVRSNLSTGFGSGTSGSTSAAQTWELFYL